MYCNDSIIAIDGGCRTSKSRLSKELSNILNVPYLDSGLLYRAFANFWKEKPFLFFFDKPIAFYEQYSKIEIVHENRVCRVCVNGVVFNPLESGHSLDQLTSRIAINIPVRLYLTNVIHQFVEDDKFIITGRDIGTFVFPETPYKIFLKYSLSPEMEGSEKGKNIIERDTRDTNRDFAPLVASENQFTLDTSLHPFDENLAILRNYVLNQGWVW